MAKKSSVQRNLKRERLVAKYAARRAKLKAVIQDKEASPEEKFEASLKMAQLPRNSAKIRLRNRCEVTGRPRGVYRKFKMCRIELRTKASQGEIPGMVKSSW